VLLRRPPSRHSSRPLRRRHVHLDSSRRTAVCAARAHAAAGSCESVPSRYHHAHERRSTAHTDTEQTDGAHASNAATDAMPKPSDTLRRYLTIRSERHRRIPSMPGSSAALAAHCVTGAHIPISHSFARGDQSCSNAEIAVARSDDHALSMRILAAPEHELGTGSALWRLMVAGLSS